MYQALYRKWRPRTFDDVVGQDHVTRTLRKQVGEGSLSHAYLFVGTRGTGKTSCAKILAKAVNCLDPQNGNPCNRCAACLGIDNGSVTDVVEMDAASNNGVDDVRALRDEAVFTPAQVKKRVYIVDEVHMLSTSAFNALLKIIEEPPEHLMFILATTDVQKVPATILSRCQRYSFKRLDINSIVGRLKYIASQESISLSDTGAVQIARISEGGMRDAVSLLDQCSGYGEVTEETVNSVLGLAGHDGIMKLCSSAAEGKAAEALQLFSDMWTDGKDPASLLGELGSLYREILVFKEAPEASNLLSGSYTTAELQEVSRNLSATAVINNLELIRACLASMRAGSAKLGCEMCIVSLCRSELKDSLAALRERVAALEELVRSGNFTAAPAPVHSAPAAQTAAPEPAGKAPEAPPVPEDMDLPWNVPASAAVAAPSPAPAPVPAYEEKKSEAPVQKAAPAPSAPAAPAQGGNELRTIQQALSEKLPRGMSAIITNNTQTILTFGGDSLHVQLLNKFASVMLGQADSKKKMEEIVSSALGRRIVVHVSEDPAPKNMTAPSPSEPPAAPAHAPVQAVQPEPKKVIPAVSAAAEERAGAAPDKLDYLRKFDIVTFK